MLGEIGKCDVGDDGKTELAEGFEIDDSSTLQEFSRKEKINLIGIMKREEKEFVFKTRNYLKCF